MGVSGSRGGDHMTFGGLFGVRATGLGRGLDGGRSLPAARIAANSMTAVDRVPITVATRASNWACTRWPAVLVSADRCISWYAWPSTHVGHELIAAGMLILAGCGNDLPFDG
jgi:hypothetical protein